jgi:hypothetical protein
MHPSLNTRFARAAAAPGHMPEKTEIVEISPDQLESVEVRAVFDIWERHRNGRTMPSREEVLPRPLGKLLRNISLMRFIPQTDDYELRFIGDAHVQAYGPNSPGQKISDTKAASPQFVAALKYSFDLVRARRAPVGYRGIMGRDLSLARFDWFETLYLPLGTGDEVQFILNASVYKPRGGKWPD